MSEHKWIEEAPPAGVNRRMRCMHCRAILDVVDKAPGETGVVVTTRDGSPPPPDLEEAAQQLLEREA